MSVLRYKRMKLWLRRASVDPGGDVEAAETGKER